jgi:hypothetical protein
VFLPESLAARFHFIHIAEQNLRRQLTSNGDVAKVTVETMSSLRATRLNVLDTNNLAAYEPGGHIYPGAADLSDKALRSSQSLEATVRTTVGGPLKEGVFTRVPLERLVRLLQDMPFDDELANMWDPQRLGEVLQRLGKRYQEQGFVYYRAMRRRSRTLPTGAVSGEELRLAREHAGPVLFVFRDDGNALDGPTNGRPYWYPSLVFPVDMATQVFNTTA